MEKTNAAIVKYEKALQSIMESALMGEVHEYLETMNYIKDDQEFSKFSEIVKYLTSNDNYSPDNVFEFSLADCGDFEFSEFTHTATIRFSGTKDKIEMTCYISTSGEFSAEALGEEYTDEEVEVFNDSAIENDVSDEEASVDSIAEALYFY